jgi:3-oxoacyl-[acyl-carrier-protein] synthase-1
MACFVNATGLVCCSAMDRDSFLSSLFFNDKSQFVKTDVLSSKRDKWVGQVTGELPVFPATHQAFYSRSNHLAYAAVCQIQAQIDVVKAKYPAHRIGVIIGTCTSGSTEIDSSRAHEKAHGQIPEGYQYSVELMDNVADFLKDYLDVSGPAISVSTACTSSGKAVAMAKRYLQAGMLDAVIVGGADSFALAPLNGFDSLASLSAGQCTPFGADRDGINLGEAAALFVFSKEQTDEAGIQVLGVGESSDGHHMSSPDPTGNGAERAVRQALADASLTPEDIGYVNFHGTGTYANDEMEAKLVSRVFGTNTPCSSTKSITGHTLGAASALEMAACVLALQCSEQHWPVIPQHNDYPLDPRLDSIELAGIDCMTTKGVSLSTSYAFGGSNTCVIVGREPVHVY